MLAAISYLMRFCWKSNRRYIIALLLWKTIDALLPLVLIIFPRFIIDELLHQQRLPYLALWVSCLLVSTFVMTTLSNYLMHKSLVERMYCYDAFQMQLANNMIRADYDRLEDPSFLDMREKAAKFLYGDGWGFATVLDRAAGILGKVGTFAGILAVIAMLEPLMVLLFIALVLVNSLFEARGKKKIIAWDLERAPLERRCTYYGNVLSDYSYGKEIRGYDLGDWLIERYKEPLSTLRGFYKRTARTNTHTANLSALLTFIQQCAAYAYLLFAVCNGSIGIGEFTMYLSAVSVFSTAMRDVMSSVVDIRRFTPYYEAAESFMNLPQHMQEGAKRPLPNAEATSIEFRNVSYRYRGKGQDALQDVSFTLRAGEKLAIVGENGAGKSTLIKLLMRLYDPTDGMILYNGVDIRELDCGQYRGLFATVFQDFKLFSFSLAENVAFDAAPDNRERVLSVTHKIDMDALLASLPSGIDTPMHKDFDANGVELSGGEAQKLVLARALFRDANFIILDEPTAALDPRAENRLYQMFDELTQNKTSVYITHRLASTQFCDHVLVLDEGRIIEEGTHKELMEVQGLYAELFELQARLFHSEQPKDACDG